MTVLKKILTASVLALCIGCGLLGIFNATEVFAQDVKLPLQIPIPNPSSPGSQITELTLCTGSGENLRCNGLAQYITAAYLWLAGALSIVVVLVIMYAGFIWLTAGGDSGKTKHAKEMISNALIGLGAVFASYSILYIINPDFVNFRPLALIQPRELSPQEIARVETQANTNAGDYASGERIASLPNLLFDSTEKADVEGGKIKQVTLDMLKALNSSGIKGIKINVLKSGHNPGSFHNNADPSRDGRAADIVGSNETMIQVAKYLFEHRTELQVNELYHSRALETAVEECKAMGTSYLSSSGLLSSHYSHVHVALGGCK